MHRQIASQAAALRHSLSALLLIGTLATQPVAATDQYNSNPKVEFSSGNKQVSLLELYTSEGCSSCPPADRWLSAVGAGTALWKSVVPVAFHVSYWDRLGWPDRFAQLKFDTRQRAEAARVDAGVYTPGLFINGQEFRNWRRTPPAAIAESPSQDAGDLSIKQLANTQWQVTYEHPKDRPTQPIKVYAAVLGNSLSNTISRGENAGKRLNHDFVVMQLESMPLAPHLDNSSLDVNLQATFSLRTNATANPAVAAWVTDTAGNTLQAVGGAL